MTDTKTKTKDSDIIANLLANMPSNDSVEVRLPSEGRFYSLPDPSKPITVRPMTFKDEKAMMSSQSGSDIINTLLSRCVSNVNIGDLLLFDKVFLIMKIRELSYGDEYGVTVQCPSCSKENKVKFFLSQLAVNYAPEELTDPCLVKLRVLDKDAKVKFPRIKDEEYLSNQEITSNNLWRFITEIDGHTKKTIISSVADKLPLKDAHTIMDVLGGVGLGVNSNVTFSCGFCSHKGEMALPITPDFFTGN